MSLPQSLSLSAFPIIVTLAWSLGQDHKNNIQNISADLYTKDKKGKSEKCWLPLECVVTHDCIPEKEKRFTIQTLGESLDTNIIYITGV